MQGTEPARNYFRVEAIPYRGSAKVWAWCVAIIFAVVLRDFSSQPARLCIISISDGSILFEKHSYLGALAKVQDLQAIVASATVEEVVRQYGPAIATPAMS